MTAASSIWHLSTDGVSDRRELVATIPLRTPNPLNGSHQHWTVKAQLRKTQRRTTYLVMSGLLSAEGVTRVTTPREREDAPGSRFAFRMVSQAVRVTLTRVAPSSGLDDDGLLASLKSVRDGIADALGVDDRDPRVTWAYDQRRGKPKEWAVEVRIYSQQNGVSGAPGLGLPR